MRNPRRVSFSVMMDVLGMSSIAIPSAITHTSINAVEIVYEGTPSSLNTRAMTQAAISGLLKPALSEVNMVNAPIIAKERGIRISEVRRDQEGAYEGYIKLTVNTGELARSVAGTVFSNGRPRLIQIKGIDMESEFAPHMLYITNEDKPGFIGKFSSTMGDAGINIATFHVGRDAPGGNAIALIEIDGELPPAVLAKVRALPQVQQARPLKF